MTSHDRDSTPVRIGRNVRKRREAAGLTQEALAQAASVTLRTVTRLEGGVGKWGPTVDVLEGLAAALGCSVADLLGAAPTKAAS